MSTDVRDRVRTEIAVGEEPAGGGGEKASIAAARLPRWPRPQPPPAGRRGSPRRRERPAVGGRAGKQRLAGDLGVERPTDCVKAFRALVAWIIAGRDVWTPVLETRSTERSTVGSAPARRLSCIISSRSSVSDRVSLKTWFRSSERSSAKSRVRLPPVASKRLAAWAVVISSAALSMAPSGLEGLALDHLDAREIGSRRSRASCHAFSSSFIRSSITERTRAFAA